jgi:uncharacterized membrane protein
VNEKKISESLNRLSSILERRSKLWNAFLTGIVTGVGTAIGATLIGAIVVGLIASNLNKIPILREILPNNFQKIVENQSN